MHYFKLQNWSYKYTMHYCNSLVEKPKLNHTKNLNFQILAVVITALGALFLLLLLLFHTLL